MEFYNIIALLFMIMCLANDNAYANQEDVGQCRDTLKEVFFGSETALQSLQYAIMFWKKQILIIEKAGNMKYDDALEYFNLLHDNALKGSVQNLSNFCYEFGEIEVNICTNGSEIDIILYVFEYLSLGDFSEEQANTSYLYKYISHLAENCGIMDTMMNPEYYCQHKYGGNLDYFEQEKITCLRAINKKFPNQVTGLDFLQYAVQVLTLNSITIDSLINTKLGYALSYYKSLELHMKSEHVPTKAKFCKKYTADEQNSCTQELLNVPNKRSDVAKYLFEELSLDGFFNAKDIIYGNVNEDNIIYGNVNEDNKFISSFMYEASGSYYFKDTMLSPLEFCNFTVDNQYNHITRTQH